MTYQLPLPTKSENIFATLAYFDIFDYPLTLEEIKKFTLGRTPSTKLLEEILSKNNDIEYKNGFYFLKNHEKNLASRIEHEKIAKKLWQKVNRFLPFIQLIPCIKMVAICNTLALNNPSAESDIDLFIITKKNRLFIARTLTTLLFSILGVRRHGKKIAGRFCLSFYVSEDGMNLEKIKLKEDIYLIYWLRTLQPLYGMETYEKFWDENLWLKKYFPEKLEEKKTWLKENKFFKFIAKTKELILQGSIGNILEQKLFSIQQKRHEKNRVSLDPEASIVVSKTMLKFHNIDRRKEFEEKFKAKIIARAHDAIQ